jgi:hypothetical protein
MESAEILLKLSRVSVSPAQVTTSCSLEIEDGIECGTVSPGTSSEGHSTKHPGTSSADIISWVDHVNELLVEYPCLPVPEMSPPTGPPGNVEISEVNWEDNKRTASDCDEDTIVVEVPETKRSRRTRLSKICEET